MTELRDALADFNRQDERRARLADAMLAALDSGTRQVDLVRATGYTREHVRRLVNDAKRRRAKRIAAARSASSAPVPQSHDTTSSEKE